MPIPNVSSEPLLGLYEERPNVRSLGKPSARERFVTFSQDTFEAVKSIPMVQKLSVRITKEELQAQVGNAWRYGICAGIVVFMTLSISAWIAVPALDLAVCGEKQKNVERIRSFSDKTDNLVAVNLGGWLCLEDWFHSGSVGRYVSTPNELERGQGACLPPLLPGPLDEPWPSEGILVHRLHNTPGVSAREVFTAFRESFITETDFVEIASLGIKTIRIPFSWSLFADALAPLDKKLYGSHDPDWEPAVVPDPYHMDSVMMVSIPRQWFKDMLYKAAKHGLRIILDLHNMPGGSSDGTYSGVWPKKPAFWNSNAKAGDGKVPLNVTGRWITDALLDYVQTDLADLVKMGAIWGICFMNEPAHLAGIKGKWGAFATPGQVLHLVSGFADQFRRSALPGQGVRLYIQLIETAWASPEAFDAQVTDWYQNFFTSEERYNWAVMARHFYTAWGCNGMITQGAAYQCDEPVDHIRSVLQPCISNFARDFAMKFHGLRAVTEWSIGTHWDANMACTSPDVQRALFEENINAFAMVSNSEIRIEPVFWSWKMPFGPKFQPGWSLKTFAGMDELADSNGRCIVGAWASESPLTR